MRLTRFLFALVVPVGLLAVGCATGPATPKVDSAGLVRIESKQPGDLFAIPRARWTTTTTSCSAT
jgi:hypothetical protein